jgi:hypothetical protein
LERPVWLEVAASDTGSSQVAVASEPTRALAGWTSSPSGGASGTGRSPGWENVWNDFIPLLDYDIEFRTVLCSTNENVNRPDGGRVAGGPAAPGAAA